VSQRLTETRRWLNDYREDQRRTAQAQPPDLFDDGATSWETPTSVADDWVTATLDEIRRVALEARHFTVDDLTIGPTPDRRAIGSALLTASKRGWIRAGAWVSGGTGRHGRPVRQWESRLTA
jgi:hypothetical protein